ncbi:MAG TPA: alanine dehydrogenase [Acidimicrobiales bacterium]|nr:alanine dehydrogenase [Acidimicrobiales bacterium]
MQVGVPRELKDSEYRVALTPAGVRELVSAGHSVFVEHTAGEGSSIPDDEYVAVGAKIVNDPDELWGGVDLVCKVKEPIEQEFHRLRRGLILFTYLHLAAARDCTEAILNSGTTAIAYETVRLADGSLPLLAPMSEVAGRMAPMVGAAHLQRPAGGRGVLLGGVPGVRAGRVVIIGAGVAGSNAAAIAVGMHADVVVIDRNLARLAALDGLYQGRLQTLASSEHAIEEECLRADLVIGAVLVVGARAPKLVSDRLVAQMLPGSVLVDISVDQGGCFESTHPTTHSEPTFRVFGSLFYCVSNMPGAVPHTSTHSLTNATLPYTMEIANLGWQKAALNDPSLEQGLAAIDGALVSQPVAEAHDFTYTPLESVLSP